MLSTEPGTGLSERHQRILLQGVRGGDGDGDGTTATPTSTTEATTTETETETATVESLQAEVDKWKKKSRQNEERAKANAEKAQAHDKLKSETMSELEKAVEDARQKARAETLLEVGADLVDAEVRAAAAGRTVDVDALLEGLDRSRFLDDDGKPKRDEIQQWLDKVAPKADTETTSTSGSRHPAPPDLGQGTRSEGSTALNGDPILDSVKQKLGIR